MTNKPPTEVLHQLNSRSLRRGGKVETACRIFVWHHEISSDPKTVTCVPCLARKARQPEYRGITIEMDLV